MERYIYYGAGQYIRSRFEAFIKKYPPLCFCDRSVTPTLNPELLFGIPVLEPEAMLTLYPDAPIFLSLSPAVSYEVQKFLINCLGIKQERIVNKYKKSLGCYRIEDELHLSLGFCDICCGLPHRNHPPRAVFSSDDSACDKVDKIYKMQEELKSSLDKGVPCNCDGCREIEYIYIRLIPRAL